MRSETIGSATLYLGDSREIVPTLNGVAAIVSDPPYGQALQCNVDVRYHEGGGRYKPSGGRNVRVKPAYPVTIAGDDGPFDPRWMLDLAPIVLLWGSHRFGSRLPDGQMLVWDKRPNGVLRSHGCGEATWLNRPGPLRIYRHLWDGLSIAGGYETRIERRGAAAAPRVHPTQKPVDLMRWCIAQAAVPAEGLICDPYMGGGSTAIAATLAGHPFVGVEIEQTYFDAACRRLEHALSAANEN